MNKSKVLMIFALFLLIFQLFAPNLGILAESENENNAASAKVEVENLSQNGGTINWNVTINTSGAEDSTANTNISFSSGQSHGSIKNVGGINVSETANGYTVETPGNSTYNLEISTVITNKEINAFALQAKTEHDQAIDEIIVEKTTPPEAIEQKEGPHEEKNTTEEESTDDASSEQTNDKKTEDSAATSESEETVTDQDKGQKEEEQTTYEYVLAELKSKPLEQFTEEEIKKLLVGLSEEDLQKLQEEFEVTEKVGVVDPNFKPFIKNSQRSFRMMSSNPSWPAPGSVKLNGKDAFPTGNYGEWEIELSVEAKDIDTTKTTDIVLVLDKSGSMQGTRLQKAKAAAIQFIHELLTEDSQTRIAVVTFSDSYQTLAGGFRGANQKQQLINAINGISASGGTNIQGGIRTANNLLSNQSSAQEKIIVLLSDGEPTYSYRANAATAHSWTYGSYNFRLSNFTNTQIGSGSSYNLSAPTCIFGFCWGGEQYSVNGFDVKTNGSATISEAWQTMTNGINMYSIGLDVGNNNNATNVLRNSQNKGYYQAGVDDLSNIFGDIAGEIKYAATNAVVTDPLGEMFNLVKGKYSGADFTASHGTVSWDDSSETFTWNIGDIEEGQKPTLKYTVTIDWEHPDLKGHVDYPMNEETPLNYRDMNGNNATKYFEIPEGQIGKGKIKRIGYRVNADGDPVDSNGNPVSSIEEAEEFYDEYYGNFHEYGSHDVPAKDVTDYTLIVGDDPTEVTIGANNPVETVYFGYVKTTELPAGNVIAKYWDEAGNPLVPDVVHTGNLGDTYETEQLDIPGYAYKEMHQDSADPSGPFTNEEQTVIYVYEQLTGTIKIVKVDKDDTNVKLPGAKFNVINSNNEIVDELETDGTGEAITKPLPVGEYTIEEVEAPTGYEVSTTNLSVTVEAGTETSKVIKNKKLRGSLTVIKKDADGNKPLPGATFELRDENNQKVDSKTTGDHGEIVFDNLAWGTYTLVETKAPEGYRLLAEEITVEITKEDLHVTKTVENSLQGWEIPKTGGIGTVGFYLTGIFLMVFAAWFIIRRRLAQ